MLPRARLLTLLLASLALLSWAAAGRTATAPAPAAAATAGTPVEGAQSSSLKLLRVARFNNPVFVTAPPGDRSRLFVVEQDGRIKVRRRGRTRTFLDISDVVQSGGERGLLSMAFAPDYARSRLFYVYFTDNNGDIRIQELRARTADVADSRSRRNVLTQEHRTFGNHNGGQIAFGRDRLLYAGLGDGGGGGDPLNNAQSLSTLLGKVIRIDPRRSGNRAYSVPRTNPFVSRAGARDEIWAYGLRNPYRFSFDRRTGDLALSDVGQGAAEEVNFAPPGRGRGADYEWPRWEGNSRYRGGARSARPVHTTSHSRGNCSITGGYVVRDRSLRGLYGRYLYSDFCNPRLYSVRLSRGRASGNRSTGLSVDSVSSFGEDARGRVYVVSLSGSVFRLAPR